MVPSTRSDASASRHILVVDDEAPVRQLLTRYLKKQRARVSAASNAPEALTLIEAGPPDLLITDVDMPGPSGLWLLGEVQRRWPSLPVIVMSGLPPANLQLHGATLDGDAFLLKPFDLTELGRRVQRLIGDVSRQAQRPSVGLELEAGLRSLVEHIPAITYMAPMDAVQARLYTGPQIEALLGFSRAEWAENPGLLLELLHEEDARHVAEQLASFQATGQPFSAEYRLRSRDCRTIWVCDEARAARDAAGELKFAYGFLIDITDRKRAEEAEELLRGSEARFRTLFERAGIGIAIVDMQGHPVESNPVLQKMLGYSADELRAMVFTDFTHPEDVAADWRLFQEVVEGRRDHYQIEKRYIRKDGQVVWGRLTASLVCGPDGAPSFGIGMVEDITEAKHAEGALRVSEERYRNLFEGVPEGLYRSAPDGTLLDVNLALVRMLGYPDRETLLAVDASRLYPSAQQRDYWQNRMAAEGVVRNFETQLRCYDGSTLWVCDSARAVCDAKGRVLYYEGALEDITERKQAEEELRNLSLADELTGLYNRRGFFTLAEKQLRLGDRTQRGVLLVFADVDGMKRINDTLGHQMGDQALKEAAELLKQTFRASDILARFGGDEFVVLAIETGKAEAESLTRRLCEKLEARNAAAPAGRELSISMGVVYYEPETGISIDDLLSRADRAMYEAKRERLGSGAAPAQGPTA